MFSLRQLHWMSFYIEDHHKQVFIHTICGQYLYANLAQSKDQAIALVMAALSLSVCLQNLSIYMHLCVIYTSEILAVPV